VPYRLLNDLNDLTLFCRELPYGVYTPLQEAYNKAVKTWGKDNPNLFHDLVHLGGKLVYHLDHTLYEGE